MRVNTKKSQYLVGNSPIFYRHFGGVFLDHSLAVFFYMHRYKILAKIQVIYFDLGALEQDNLN